MTLQDAFALFRRLGVDPELLSGKEFCAAYHRLAWRYHPDMNPATHDLMASINAARTTILNSYRGVAMVLLPFWLAAELLA